MKKKPNSATKHCSVPCLIFKGIMWLVLLILVLVSGIGLYQTHVIHAGDLLQIQFGSANGSLAIIACTLACAMWMKHSKNCLKSCEVCNG